VEISPVKVEAAGDAISGGEREIFGLGMGFQKWKP
jgi:hypothetical protein